MPTVEQLRDAALAYAERGFAVFPVRAGTKDRPATEHGRNDASRDPEVIKRWWAYSPYNIAIATGPESGILVVDVDTYKDVEWEPAAVTYAVSTGRGGTHYYFKWPQGVAKNRPMLKAGVDIKGAGGYVIAPPSSVQEGDYAVRIQGEIADAPADLLAEIAIVEGAQPVDQRPGDRFNEEADWEADVLGPHGWVLLGRVVGGFDAWTRPGKDDGVSATTGLRSDGAHGNEPADLLYVFTTSTPFEADRGYSKFAAYAVLNHGGDIAAAASQLASDYAPKLSAPSGAAASPNAAAPSLGGSRVSPPASAAPTPYTSPLPEDHFVSRYIAYAGMLTDAAPEYLEAAALALLSALTPSVRINLAFAPDGLRTNLFTALVGMSSKSRKSTAQQIAASLLRELQPDAVLPDRMTGELAISRLAQRSGRTALWLPDEFGVMVQQIYSREFLRPLEEVLLTLYGGQTYTYATMARTETVENVHLVVFGAATPESFAGAGSRAITSGLLPRFGIVYPASPPPSRPPQASSDEHKQMRGALRDTLRELYFKQSEPHGQRNITFDPLALTVLSSADAVFSKHAMTARLSTSAYKIAALLALVEGRFEVSPQDAVAAFAITERWADGALRLRSHLARSPQDVAFEESLEMARAELALIPHVAEIAGRRVLRLVDIARALKVEYTKLRRIQQTLEVTNEVIVADYENESAWHVAL